MSGAVGRSTLPALGSRSPLLCCAVLEGTQRDITARDGVDPTQEKFVYSTLYTETVSSLVEPKGRVLAWDFMHVRDVICSILICTACRSIFCWSFFIFCSLLTFSSLSLVFFVFSIGVFSLVGCERSACDKHPCLAISIDGTCTRIDSCARINRRSDDSRYVPLVSFSLFLCFSHLITTTPLRASTLETACPSIR